MVIIIAFIVLIVIPTIYSLTTEGKPEKELLVWFVILTPINWIIKLCSLVIAIITLPIKILLAIIRLPSKFFKDKKNSLLNILAILLVSKKVVVIVLIRFMTTMGMSRGQMVILGSKLLVFDI